MVKPITREMASDMKAEIAFLEGATDHQLAALLMRGFFEDQGHTVPTEKEVEGNFPSYAPLFRAMTDYVDARTGADASAVMAAKRTVEGLMRKVEVRQGGDAERQEDYKKIQAAWAIAQADELVTHQEAMAQMQIQQINTLDRGGWH